MDDALRHSITKLSHLHFVATEEYARRVLQLGEEPWRVTVTGAPSLDNLSALEALSAQQIEAEYRVSLTPAPLLVTFHPVTLEYEQTAWHIGELLAALDACEQPVIFTLPNADTHSSIIIRMVKDFVSERPVAHLLDNLGTRAYFSLMSLSAAMVGNSSSGIIEAASFGLPVVNIGTRQKGRVRAENVIDVGYSRTEVLHGIRKALHPDFGESLRRISNPYDCGGASDRIVQRLKRVEHNDELLKKRFYDLESSLALRSQ
jgi:UDP-hydrolysing UDP-N-acetyl-D-glucosamine 2-epimerase